MNLTLSIDDLTCIRGTRTVFTGLALKAAGGTYVSLEGPNGSGKTSLLRMVAGFLNPAAGRIAIAQDGMAIDDAEERGALVGWLGHQDAVKPQMTVLEQIAFWSQLYGAEGDARDILRTCGLARLFDVPGQFLSAGQRRRLALARLSLTKRPIWVLDEPLAALDTDGKGLVVRAIEDHCASGGIVLAATHEPLGLPAQTLRLGAA